MDRKTKIFIFIVLFAAALFFKTDQSRATGYQTCQPGADCVLGEFLYDDTFVPVTTDVCVVNIHDPDGAAIVSDEGTTYGASDGWHAYTFTGTSPEGLYRATMCCDDAGDTVCTDKSFILQTTSAGSENSDAATQDDVDEVKNDIQDDISGLKKTIKSGFAGINTSPTPVSSVVVQNNGAEPETTGGVNSENISNPSNIPPVQDNRTSGPETKKEISLNDNSVKIQDAGSGFWSGKVITVSVASIVALFILLYWFFWRGRTKNI